MKIRKLLIAAVLVVAVGAPIAGFVGDTKAPQSTLPIGERVAFFHGLGGGPIASQSELASLARADEWLNSPPLTASALRGKVVLVHFWTYTCINWLRTQSYVRAWAEKYKDKGLVVIGVHTPEFRFEKNIDNVRREAKALRVDYPVAVDSDYVIWRAFNNNYWPAQYFIDAQGRVRHSPFRRGRVRPVGNGHSAPADGSRRQRHRRRSGVGRTARFRSGRRLGKPQVSGKLCRLRAHRGLCFAGRRGPRQASHL